MRAFGIGLAAALIVAAMASSAFAAKDDIPPDARKAGMAAAPGLIVAGHVPCTLTDARLMGVGQGEDKVKTTYYEIACKDALGYIVALKDKVPVPTTYDCVIMSAPGPDGKPNPSACILPGNLNPGAGLNADVAAAGRTCSIDKARYIGSTEDQNLYEVACHEGDGYILRLAKAPGGAPIATMCAVFGTAGQVKCTLIPPEQQMASIDHLASAIGKACTVKDRRYVGSTADLTDFFEVACGEGSGYMLQVDSHGKVQQAIDCVKAVNLAGGCTLTDTRQAQTEQNATYADLAKKAGFDCAVSKYADFPARADGAEVVELACSNRADGGVGIFPVKGAPQVLDCLHAGAQGYACSYSDVTPLYGKLSAQLKAKNKGSCVVSGARPYARTGSGGDLIEVACADGGPGWVIEYAPDSVAVAALHNCAEAATMGGGGCQLPTNKTH
jgi:hypothetical protein